MSLEKDFMDFLKDVSENQPRLTAFMECLNSDETTEGGLCQLLHQWGYDGVRIKDCATLLDIVRAQGPLPCNFEQKY
jgi:hypothetical protein